MNPHPGASVLLQLVIACGQARFAASDDGKGACCWCVWKFRLPSNGFWYCGFTILFVSLRMHRMSPFLLQ